MNSKTKIWFKEWWSVPSHQVWTIRIVIFSSQILLVLGVAIFMWLNFSK